ncbi:Hypothetical predicted protein [Podarcis lilfordi]|uniref:Uncharacterized protein n=1 Tax=Podarcis lilfordi TaxID=74358 RepID=A0AA35P9C9_9SAUR|nr:Hypothetical predicted protein [Podarcis lilfordi]
MLSSVQSGESSPNASFLLPLPSGEGRRRGVAGRPGPFRGEKRREVPLRRRFAAGAPGSALDGRKGALPSGACSPRRLASFAGQEEGKPRTSSPPQPGFAPFAELSPLRQSRAAPPPTPGHGGGQGGPAEPLDPSGPSAFASGCPTGEGDARGASRGQPAQASSEGLLQICEVEEGRAWQRSPERASKSTPPRLLKMATAALRGEQRAYEPGRRGASAARNGGKPRGLFPQAWEAE